MYRLFSTRLYSRRIFTCTAQVDDLILPEFLNMFQPLAKHLEHLADLASVAVHVT